MSADQGDTDPSDDDSEGCGEDVIPVDFERDLVTGVPAVRSAVPVESGIDTPAVITPPLRPILAQSAALTRRTVEVRSQGDICRDTHCLVSGTLEVSLSSETVTRPNVIIWEHVTPSVRFSTLVSSIITMLRTVTDGLRGDTESVTTFEARHSVLQLTLPDRS